MNNFNFPSFNYGNLYKYKIYVAKKLKGVMYILKGVLN